MSVEYGIMIDVIKNKDKTIESAKEAVKHYQEISPSFKLVGVAQGNNVPEYLECYEKLKDFGFEFIAIGGLLKKIENTARYVRVRDEQFWQEVVKSIRQRYPKDWLFLLGCYNPKRHDLLKKYNIFGADYKGWILNYKNPNQIFREKEKILTKLENNLQINDEEIKELRKKYYSLSRKADVEEFRAAKDALISARLKIARKISNQNYLKILKRLVSLLNMSTTELRKQRFKQVKKHLQEQIFRKLQDDKKLDNDKKLLIVSCSKRKKRFQHPAPAIEVYDGPVFRVLRSKLKDKKNLNLHIRIISAKYGLITPETPIRYYNQRLSKDTIREWNGRFCALLRGLLHKNNYSEIFVCLGNDYLLAINGFDNDVSSNCKITYANGRIGQRLRQTRAWVSNILRRDQKGCDK
jgi:hypothetical protein